ncbi:MAG: hypothetical protein JNJ51_08580 [Methylobacillus glycogenes]|nr:hypothetical protein [Methylobacillus glycogenes]
MIRHSNTTSELHSIAFTPDGQRGWAVGFNGSIITTADGGQTWTPQSSGTNNELQSVFFTANGQHGWVVGFGGTILATRNGGASWSQQNSGTSNELASVFFTPAGRWALMALFWQHMTAACPGSRKRVAATMPSIA